MNAGTEFSSCRAVLDTLRVSGAGARCANAGLLLQRYLREQGDQGKARRELLAGAIEAVGRAGVPYRAAYQRFEASLPKEAAKRYFAVDGRLAVGLGEPSPLEVGLRLHHTYGAPVIPGSGLKGLAAHYCRSVWGQRDSEFPAKVVETLFGSTQDAGRVVFHDAWVTPDSLPGSLALDVVTAHHPDYYRGVPGAAPGDFDEPDPIPFLSVTGTFLVAVQVDEPGPGGRSWTELAMALLTEALADWGAGGKTNAGYGRMLAVAGPGLTSDAGSGAAPDPAGGVRPAAGGARGDGAVTAGGSPPRRAVLVVRRGDLVRVRRVEDPKGRGRLWFRLVEGEGQGTVLPGGTPVEVALGDEIELAVYSVGESINFAWPDAPALGSGGGGSQARRGPARHAPGPDRDRRKGRG